MDLILAIDKELGIGLYLSREELIDKYVSMGYTIYLEHPDGTYEKIRDPYKEETENQNGSN